MDKSGKNLYKGKEEIIPGHGGREKDNCRILGFHMRTVREKISLVLTGLAYLVFHLGTNSTVDNISLASVISGTLQQILTTLPYCLGGTFVALAAIRVAFKGQRPPWDRILRIFFTIGIILGFYFNLYNSGYRAEQERLKRENRPVTGSLIPRDESRTARSGWASAGCPDRSGSRDWSPSYSRSEPGRRG